MKTLRFYFVLLFVVTLSFSETVSLQKGWNLLGVDSNLSLPELQTKIGIDNLLVIQGQKKTYQKQYVDVNKSFLNDFEAFEVGMGYWIKVANSVTFNYSKIVYQTEQNITLQSGWNLINPPSDLNLSEIIAQLGSDNLEVIQGTTKTYQRAYLSINPSLNDFQKFEEPQGYWIKLKNASLLRFSFSSTLPMMEGLLSTYLNKMQFGTEGDNLWKSSTLVQQALVREIVTDILNGRYMQAHTKAQTLNGEVVKFIDNLKEYYVLHLDLERLNDGNYRALGGTYVFYPKGENSAIQVPHPAFDTNTDIEGIETYLGMNSRYLLLSGTHRNSVTSKSPCQLAYQESDASHNSAHYFYNVHETLSAFNSKTLFIELHGFGSSTRETLWSECDSSQNPKLINISEGVEDTTNLDETTFMHLFHKQITDTRTIKSCLYSPSQNSSSSDIYTSSLGGTLNIAGRFTNGSANVCSSSATTSLSSHRFIHIEQSYDVRQSERTTILNALKTAQTQYNEIDIAHKFGKATQGGDPSYYYYEEASLAIDNNDSTYNHTEGTTENNWWQVELPNPTRISKIMIQGRNSNTTRLSGANVYITQEPFIGTLDENSKVATLLGNGLEQVTTFATPKSGKYLLVKASGTNNLHMVSVEVYGETPVTPIITEHESSYLIKGSSLVGDIVTTINGVDYQADELIYSINNSAFSIDANGVIRVNSALQSGAYNVIVTISDGVNAVTGNLTINVTTSTAVADALSSGSVTQVTEEELIQAARDEISSLRTGNSLLSQIYQNGSISYTSGNYHSQLIKIYGDVKQVFPILYGNKSNVLAVAGQKEMSRFSVFASNPLYFFDRDENLDYEPYMKRVFVWLIGGEPIDMNLMNTNKTVALSFVSDSSAVERWITKSFPNWSLKSCNDKLTLEGCYSDADLVLLGRSGTDSDAVAMRSLLPKMLTEAKPILYLHDNWGQNNLSQVVADLFDFSFPYGGNYWAGDAASWTDIEEMQSAVFNSFGYAFIDTILTHFQDKDYSFDWTQCTDGKGAFGSQYDKCGDVVGLNSEFQKGATKVREMMNGLDGSKKNVFLSTGYRLQKLLALIGDRFRQSVAYPMDKATTDDNEFMKSYYSDHAVYNYRFINPVQKDMGNFSRSDFSHITPHSKTVNLTSKKNFRSTGVYALPGQTMRVTRNDHSAVTTKVFINSLRLEATHEFESNGYKRPKFLQTPSFTIDSGESIELTSPYGGPVHIAFDTNDLNVSFTFENIGEHAYWANPADDASFTQKLDSGDFDWAEVVTSAFEVHSTLDKMRESVADAKWGTAQALANATKKYMSNYPHVLAGFKGPGIDVVDEIHDFAIENNLTIENLDLVKHMNADQATCGYGCSGNPYDAYWAFSPIGHGDVHELGHGLEKSRFKFEGFEGHAVTNPYSYYTKSKYNETTGGDPDCQNLPFKEVFEKLQASVNESNSTAYLKTNLWATSDWSKQVLVTIQAMMHTQKMGKLENGWHLLARLHILERQINWAKGDWENRKASLGFTDYTLDEFNVMRNNDWLLVSFSFVSGLDFRDYLTMMGIEYSQKASDQVASFDYPMVPKKFFVSTPNGYCKSDDTYGAFLDKSSLPIDGSTAFLY